MGLMKCEYCDSPISTMAHKCPNCGGVVTTGAKKQSNPQPNVEKKKEGTNFKGFLEKVGLILKRVIKYFLIAIVSFTVISIIITIVVLITMT